MSKAVAVDKSETILVGAMHETYPVTGLLVVAPYAPAHDTHPFTVPSLNLIGANPV